MWDQVQGGGAEWGMEGQGGPLTAPEGSCRKVQTGKGSSLGDGKVEQRRGGVLNSPSAIPSSPNV